jgi:hypothetical protein
MIECSKEDFASNQERKHNRYIGGSMEKETKFVTKGQPNEDWKKAPGPTDAEYEEIMSRALGTKK